MYCNIHCPKEFEHLFPQLKADGKPGDMAAMMAAELSKNKSLLNAGDGDSSGGSDSEPSDDNLPVEEVAKVVPIVDVKQKQLLQKNAKKKVVEEEKKKPDPPKPKKEESPTRSPSPRERRPTRV